MPNIHLRVPKNAFPGPHRSLLLHKIHDAAARAEQLPDDPIKRLACWVLLEELDDGAWSSGIEGASPPVLPCYALVQVPAGVLDEAARALYVRLVDEAFRQALPEGGQRPLLSSVVLQEVLDGYWGGNGKLQRLADLARMAGYAHLQAPQALAAATAAL